MCLILYAPLDWQYAQFPSSASDADPKSVAEKLHALNSPQDKPHKRNSRHTEVGKYLQDLQAKPPIAWGKMDDVKWSTLDNAVYSKLHKCNSLSERVKLFEDTIHEESLKIFGHAPAKEIHKLSGKNRRTLRSIYLIKLKNSLLRQISSANAVQKVALEQLLVQARCKIKSMRSAERSRKNRWKFKRGQLAFKANPYKAGKSLLDPKCKATLHVNKETLDHHKSSTVSDQFYDIPLDDLEGLPPTPSITKPFSLKEN